MTATRIVCASYAIACTAILILAACSGPGPEPGSPEALYVNLGCAKCHGENRQGQRSGPPLDALAGRWQEEDLVEYFADPKAAMELNPRLKYIAESYPIVMPGYPDTSKEDLQKLARFILES
jgi:cytochrome c551/c552